MTFVNFLNIQVIKLKYIAKDRVIKLLDKENVKEFHRLIRNLYIRTEDLLLPPLIPANQCLSISKNLELINTFGYLVHVLDRLLEE